MAKRKNNNNNHIEDSSISSTPTDNKNNESISSYEDDDSNNKRIIMNKYYGNITKSVFEIKDFILNNENFLDWYEKSPISWKSQLQEKRNFIYC